MRTFIIRLCWYRWTTKRTFNFLSLWYSWQKLQDRYHIYCDTHPSFHNMPGQERFWIYAKYHLFLFAFKTLCRGECLFFWVYQNLQKMSKLKKLQVEEITSFYHLSALRCMYSEFFIIVCDKIKWMALYTPIHSNQAEKTYIEALTRNLFIPNDIVILHK